MNFYEIVYIVHSALQAGHLDDTVNQINKKIDQLKGEILFFENWGKKKLSYLIQKQKYGTYIFFQCKIDGKKINDLTSEFEHNANILRHLISKITEDEILESKVVDNDVAHHESVKVKKEIVKKDEVSESKNKNVEKIEEADKTEELAKETNE